MFLITVNCKIGSTSSEAFIKQQPPSTDHLYYQSSNSHHDHQNHYYRPSLNIEPVLIPQPYSSEVPSHDNFHDVDTNEFDRYLNCGYGDYIGRFSSQELLAHSEHPANAHLYQPGFSSHSNFYQSREFYPLTSLSENCTAQDRLIYSNLRSNNCLQDIPEYYANLATSSYHRECDKTDYQNSTGNFTVSNLDTSVINILADVRNNMYYDN